MVGAPEGTSYIEGNTLGAFDGTTDSESRTIEDSDGTIETECRGSFVGIVDSLELGWEAPDGDVDFKGIILGGSDGVIA